VRISLIHYYESHNLFVMAHYATVAQLVERLTCNEDVAGSTPAGGSTELLIEKKFSGRCPSGQREQTVNLPAYAFEGSNPSLPTVASVVQR
jgi:hypothetical protein